ncbi:MAG: hypothetical protein Q4A06_10275 [Cardiobacteriaceae bacterium]|nr:hypothetical protein [Cardiobacteriaceae bacterium]
MLKIAASLILQGFQRVKTFEHKKCPFCGSKHTKKNGTKNHKQQYKCRDCQRQFLGGKRLNPDDLWHHYTRHKQTAAGLAQKHNVSRRTISRHLEKAHTESAFPTPKTANLVLDTTCFGRHHGVMVLLDAVSKQALFVGEVTHESSAPYLAAIAKIQEKDTVIQSITGDGRKGFAQLLPGVPVQMCHFHQVQIINRYLTRNPKSVAACELRALVLNLKNSTETSFKEALAAWHTQHKNYLNERGTHPVNRTLALHTQALEKRL